MDTSYKKLLAITILISVISSSLQISCPEVRQRPHKTLKHLRRNFMFVDKSFTPQPSSARARSDVTAKMPGTSICPWTWSQDDNPHRVPRFLTKAVCPNCRHYCRAVLYHHRGLVQRCDVKTGQTVWKWTMVELPVAFVYDP